MEKKKKKKKKKRKDNDYVDDGSGASRCSVEPSKKTGGGEK